MKTLSLRVPKALHDKLIALARQTGKSKSALIRDALEGLLSKDGGAPTGSFYELAKDLIGSVEGPGDLSYNPKYMRDFGR